MQIYELITHFGVSYVGQYMGCFEGKTALKNVYKIVPVPKQGHQSKMTFEPTLMPVFFYADNNQVIEFNDADILSSNEIIDEIKKTAYNSVSKEKF